MDGSGRQDLADMRVCIKCGEAKPDSDFARVNKRSATGLCRACRATRKNAYYRANQAVYREYNARYYRSHAVRVRRITVRPLNLNCSRCERPDLTVDDFGWQKNGYRSSYCRRCQIEKARAWQNANRDYLREKARERYWIKKRQRIAERLKAFAGD